MEITLTPIHPDAKQPVMGTKKSAAYDLCAVESVHIPWQSLGMISTGLVLSYPEDWVAIIALRSSTPKRWSLLMPHGIGIIDRDYCGPNDELKIQVFNFGPQNIVIPKGERIAQLLFIRSELPTIFHQSVITGESRGGFGSTNTSN